MEATEFLKIASLYQLGDLPTEQPHQKSKNLSALAQNEPGKSIDVLKAIEVDSLRQLIQYSDQIEELSQSIKKVLSRGNRIFLCGCGATGRLALTLEFLWREQNPGSDQVQAFMAGGDIALVHSLEGFEDYPGYGADHLKQLGFTPDDLLIGITEGGETPYVIGATQLAAEISNEPTYFVYCNPSQKLQNVARSRQVFENDDIVKISLYTGSMALAGSTRLQASTVLQLGVGSALLLGTPVRESLEAFALKIENFDFSPLENFIRAESAAYQEGHYVLYQPHDFAITTFTDTTERSPTFSLPPFENPQRGEQTPSLCYIAIPQAESPESSWQFLLNRKPLALNWPERDPRTTADYLSQFDFSPAIEDLRGGRLAPAKQYKFVLSKDSSQICWEFRDHKWQFAHGGLAEIHQHTLVKVLLNIHSTLLMGRLGRYHSNIMTWVSPTNGKLIDRSVRNTQFLLQQEGLEFTYEDIVHALFKKMQDNQPDQPVVVRTFEFLKESANHAGHK